MPKTAITLEVLPAGYGDCLLISCPVGRRTWRMLVDTGPDECYPGLRSRAGVMSGSECKDTGAGFHPLAVAERGEIALKT